MAGAGFARGAQDYLVKLPDPIELIARIRYHSRGYVALLERNEAYKALEITTQRLVEELAQAARFVRSLLPDPLTGEIVTDWRFLPSVQLGGDAFGYHWIDPDHFAIYLLDVCGHGVESALLSVSAMNVVRNHTLPSTDFRHPAQVMTRMNDAFQMDRQNGLYFTMWYGVFDRMTRQLAFSSAGHPPAVIVTDTSDEPIVLMKPGLMVGGIAGTTFDADVVYVPPHSRLYLFSDGVYELTKPDDTMMTFDEFVQILAERPESDASRVEGIITTLRQLRGSDQFEDDVSIVEVRF